MHDVVVKKFTFDISSPDELLCLLAESLQNIRPDLDHSGAIISDDGEIWLEGLFLHVTFHPVVAGMAAWAQNCKFWAYEIWEYKRPVEPYLLLDSYTNFSVFVGRTVFDSCSKFRAIRSSYGCLIS